MRTAMTLGRDDGWTRHVARMVGLSTAVHVGIFAAIMLVGAYVASRRPPPIVAYSVELTDFPGTGGRLPTGPGKDVIGRGPSPAATPARSAPAEPPAAAPPKPAVAAPVKVAEAVAPKAPPPPALPNAVEKAVEVKKVAPAVPPKKVEAKKPEVVKPEVKKVETSSAERAKPAPTPATTNETKPEAAKPTEAKAAEAKPAAQNATPPATAKPAAPGDDYATAAQRFRDRMTATGSGAGAPGAGTAGGGAGGVLGEGGDGRGGGQLISLEQLAYKTRIINAVKERWSNAISRPGLVASVFFRIARDGAISDVRLARSSGNAIYDQTAVAAVERVGQLPPPPAAYVDKFAEFEINFHGDEMGGAT